MNAPASVIAPFVERARELYSLPAVAMRVLELTNRPCVDLRALKECLEADPALAARLLRVVNSSLFGLSRAVTDLNQALALLGIKPLKMLVLGFSLPKDLFTALEADVLARFWRHTLTKAVVARDLAQRYWGQSGEDAFIAGLLQEIGELVLIQDLGEPYVRFAQRVLSEGGDLLALELETLGFDHALLSARLLDHWGLPESIVRGVGAPHDAAAILALPRDEQPLAQWLHLAELLTRLLTTERPQALEELLAACRQYGRPEIEALPLLLDDLGDKVGQLAEVLNLQLDQQTDYRSVLAEAHGQLAGVAREAAIDLLQNALVGEAAALTEAVAELARRPAALPRQSEASAPTAPLARMAAVAPPTSTTSTTPREGPRETPRESPPRTASPSARDGAWRDPGLEGLLLASLEQCRRARGPLSLALAEVDRFDQSIMLRGVEATLDLMRQLERELARQLDPPCACRWLGDGQFALVLIDYDRQEGLALLRELTRAVRVWSTALALSGDTALALSIGLASLDYPPKNFPPGDLIAAARRCLAGAQLSGGDTVKSIDVV